MFGKKKVRLWLLVMLCLMAAVVCAQGVGTSLIAGSEGLGNRAGSIWGVSAYPAGLPDGAVSGLGCFGEKRFLTDLFLMEFAVAGKLGDLPYLVQAMRMGNGVLDANGLALSAGKKVHERLNLGVRMGYRYSRARGYKTEHAFSIGFGSLFKCSEQLTVGFQADGVNDFFSRESKYSYAVRAGIGYRASSFLLLTAEVVSEPFFPAALFVALHYRFGEQAWARAGYFTQMRSFLCSAGFEVSGMGVEMFSTYHLALGMSAGLSLVYRFKPLP